MIFITISLGWNMFKKNIFLGTFFVLSLSKFVCASDFLVARKIDAKKIHVSSDDLISPECVALVKVGASAAATTAFYLAGMPLLGSMGATTTSVYGCQAYQKIVKLLEKQEQMMK
jgi:hypothetical protein